jgi:GNAT superfamily N-acetyltransferase
MSDTARPTKAAGIALLLATSLTLTACGGQDRRHIRRGDLRAWAFAVNDTTHGIRIRPGGPADAPAVLDMLDSAVVWMNDRGSTEQWGTTPYSRQPGGAARAERYTTENAPYIAERDGTPAGALVLDSGPSPRLPIAPAEEPERYVRLLVSDRRYAGLGIGAELLAHAAEETRRAGVKLLRVDCWAGGGGGLVAFYERNGFTPTDRFLSGRWPGQVLARRVGRHPGQGSRHRLVRRLRKRVPAGPRCRPCRAAAPSHLLTADRSLPHPLRPVRRHRLEVTTSPAGRGGGMAPPGRVRGVTDPGTPTASTAADAARAARSLGHARWPRLSGATRPYVDMTASFQDAMRALSPVWTGVEVQVLDGQARPRSPLRRGPGQTSPRAAFLLRPGVKAEADPGTGP